MPQVVAIILWVLLGLISLPIAYILFGCVCALFVNRKKQYTKHNGFYRFLLNSITIMVLFILRVKIHVTGREHLPEGRFLLASNHRSNYDPIVTWAVLRKQNLAFVSKPSNFKIPFFGWIARRCCFMAIDRENARNAITQRQRPQRTQKARALSKILLLSPKSPPPIDCKMIVFLV